MADVQVLRDSKGPFVTDFGLETSARHHSDHLRIVQIVRAEKMLAGKNSVPGEGLLIRRDESIPGWRLKGRD